MCPASKTTYLPPCQILGLDNFDTQAWAVFHFLEQRGYVPFFGHMDVLFVLKDALRDDFGVGLRRPFRESFVTQP